MRALGLYSLENFLGEDPQTPLIKSRLRLSRNELRLPHQVLECRPQHYIHPGDGAEFIYRYMNDLNSIVLIYNIGKLIC